MSVTSDATHVGSDPGSPQVHGPGGGGLRGPLNWFGLAFGLVVLVGVALLFALTDGPGRATEDADAVDVATEPRATEERRAADEPAAETAGAGRADDAPAPVAEPAAEPADTGHAADPPAPAADVAGKAVIEIEMVDYAYAPDTVDIRAGVPVVFRFTNTGNFPHEAMVGDMHQQEEFEAEGDHDADDGHHGDVMAVMVQPGETADLEVVVAEPGTTYMACHIPGHYERGQIATINVAA